MKIGIIGIILSLICVVANADIYLQQTNNEVVANYGIKAIRVSNADDTRWLDCEGKSYVVSGKW